MSVSQSVQRVLVIADLTDVTLVNEDYDEDGDRENEDVIKLSNDKSYLVIKLIY